MLWTLIEEAMTLNVQPSNPTSKISANTTSNKVLFSDIVMKYSFSLL